jgi:phage protein U
MMKSRGQRVAVYSEHGHPSIEELMAQQGTGPITDVSALQGDFWPEEEGIEDFLAALHEWRGHTRTHPRP